MCVRRSTSCRLSPAARRWSLRAGAALGLALIAGQAGAQLPDPEPLPPGIPGEEEVEVLTQGPVHEAYAAPVFYDAQAGPVAPTEPPPVIEELPPDERPEGDDVEWIPGYWSWDDTRGDFLWVSGIWRALPPDRQWIPGYWTDEAGRWQWVSGYWAPVEVETAAYYAAPPKSLEAGPNTPAPSVDHLWVPGAWQPFDGRFAWRPGFWMPTRPEWVWVPSQWVWTPGGYVFVEGYWDAVFERRGVLFAPVFVPSPFRRVAWTFGPTVVLQPPVVFQHFFCRPRWRSFYFGDYYAPHCVTMGFYPTFSFHMSSYGYDPVYAHTVVYKMKSDGTFVTKVKDRYAYLRANPDARPPVTYVKQVTKVKNVDKTVIKDSKNVTVISDSEIAAPLREVREKSGPKRFEHIDPPKQKQARDKADRIVEFSKDRRRIETEVSRSKRGGGDGKVADPKPVVVVQPRSPAASVPSPSRPEARRAPPRPETRSPVPGKPRVDPFAPKSGDPRATDPRTPKIGDPKRPGGVPETPKAGKDSPPAKPKDKDDKKGGGGKGDKKGGGKDGKGGG